MAIKIKGNKVRFSGKDKSALLKEAKRLELTPQQLFTGLLWERVLRTAREKASNGR